MTRDQRKGKPYLKSSNKKFKTKKAFPKMYRRKRRSSKEDVAEDKHRRLWKW